MLSVTSVFGIILLLIPIGFLAVSVYERFEKEREVAKKRELREAELDELKGRAAALESRVERLESDRGIEAEIRDRFDVVKEGEQVVVILDNEDVSTGSNQSEQEEVKESFLDWLKFW